MNQPENQIPKILNIPDQDNPNKPKKKARKNLVKDFLRDLGKDESIVGIPEEAKDIDNRISQLKNENEINDEIWFININEIIQEIIENKQTFDSDILRDKIKSTENDNDLEETLKGLNKIFSSDETMLGYNNSRLMEKNSLIKNQS